MKKTLISLLLCTVMTVILSSTIFAAQFDKVTFVFADISEGNFRLQKTEGTGMEAVTTVNPPRAGVEKENLHLSDY